METLYQEPNCMGDYFHHPETNNKHCEGSQCFHKIEDKSDINTLSIDGMYAKDFNNSINGLGLECSVQGANYGGDNDNDQDVGYSSHSTCSSCQNDSQMEQESLTDKMGSSGSLNFDVSTDRECRNDIEDLIYHFDKYFRGKFDAEMQQNHSNIQSILTEQQIHFHHIVKCFQGNEREAVVPGSPARKVKRWSSSSNTEENSPKTTASSLLHLLSPSPSMLNSYLHTKSPMTPVSDCVFQGFNSSNPMFLSPMIPSPVVSSGDSIDHKEARTVSHPLVEQDVPSSENSWKERSLLQLTSLACGINAILQRNEYKT